MKRLAVILRYAVLLLLICGASACGQLAVSSGAEQAAQVHESVSGLPTTSVYELPREARVTLERISEGGPFPYDRDGMVFQNRERLLPLKPRGYYREYTVPTPGEDDRGARRLVVGEEGEVYYTADHYESFVEVVP